MRFKIILEAAKGYMEVERQITPRAGAIYTRFTMNQVSVAITFYVIIAVDLCFVEV